MKVTFLTFITFVKYYLVAIISFLFFDGIWLSSTTSWLYRPVINAVTKQDVSFRWLGAIAAWKLLALILVVHRVAYPTTLSRSWLGGALMGLSIYGVFNATNYAIFPEWTAKVSIYDTLWGVTVCGLVALLLQLNNFS
jgi:uncharacterized membrane protein